MPIRNLVSEYQPLLHSREFQEVGSSLERVAKMTIIISDPKNFEKLNPLFKAWRHQSVL